MKRKMILGLVVLSLLNGISYSTLYEIGAGENLGGLIIDTGDELIMTGGWGITLSCIGSSQASIYDTDDGKQLMEISAGSSSLLNIYGGTIGTIELTNSNTTVIKGGNIGTLISAQEVYEDGGMGIHIPMTALYVSEWSYNDTTMLLTGKWQDLTPFSIQLEDKYGISTYDNLAFIPEPCSLVLFGLTGLILRKRK